MRSLYYVKGIILIFMLSIGLIGCATGSGGNSGLSQFNSSLSQFNRSLNDYNRQQQQRNSSMYTGFNAGNGLDFNH